MKIHRFARRFRCDSGTVTAELAVAMVTFTVLLTTVLFTMSLAQAAVAVQRAAGDAARQLARGDSETDAAATVYAVAGANAVFDIQRGTDVTAVTVRCNWRPPGGLLAGAAIPLRGTASAVIEDQPLAGGLGASAP